MPNTENTIREVKTVLSSPRLATYEAATGVTRPDDPKAVALYAWNASVSAALLAPLHICEVSIRNAVSEAIEAVYGPDWPRSSGFTRSLAIPSQPSLYNPRTDVQRTARRYTTTGKVIPELKFVFWQQMFDSRHEARIWNRSLHTVLPHLDRSKSVAVLRQEIHDGLERVRTLRERHEDQAKQQLATAMQSRSRCQLDVDNTAGKMVLARGAQLSAGTEARTSAADLLAHQAYVERIGGLHRAQLGNLRQHDATVNARQHELIQASVQRQTLERLKQKGLDAHLRESARVEQNTLDEIAGGGFRRRTA